MNFKILCHYQKVVSIFCSVKAWENGTWQYFKMFPNELCFMILFFYQLHCNTLYLGTWAGTQTFNTKHFLKHNHRMSRLKRGGKAACSHCTVSGSPARKTDKLTISKASRTREGPTRTRSPQLRWRHSHRPARCRGGLPLCTLLRKLCRHAGP